MSNINSEVKTQNRDDSHKRLVVFSFLSAFAIFLLAVFHPLDTAVDETTRLSFTSVYGWLAAQAFLPTVPITLATMLISLKWPKIGFRIGAVLLALLPALILCDLIVFHWIGERLLSPMIALIGWTMLPGLLPFISQGTILTAIGCLIAAAGSFWLSCWISKRISLRWSVENKKDLTPVIVLLVTAAVALLASSPALFQYQRTLCEMRLHSTRHPLCALHMVGHRNIGMSVPTGAESVMACLHGLILSDMVNRRIDQLNNLTFPPPQTQVDHPPDVLIVIVESLQSELLNSEAMPHVHAYAERGFHLRNHFSGGNASNLGIFSLLNGMEATWFPKSRQFDPLMIQSFHQAGYEIGFYGGTDDWTEFKMEGFVNPELYDDFHVEPVDWLNSDRRSVHRANQFLTRKTPGGENPPRLAIVYMFSSHSPFASLPSEAVFQPAASKYRGTPFPKSARPSIFNHYQNSVRSVDYLISPLLQPDRIIVVLGDHGESLLEDGTIGHGTRLSRIQNATAAMIYLPNRQPRVIKKLTTHVDVLPTILAAIGHPVESNVFQGVNLNSVTDDKLSNRVLSSSNYISDEMMLLGPWTNDPMQPYAYRCAFSMDQWKVAPLNPINSRGLKWDATEGNGIKPQETTAAIFHDWLVDRFGIDPTADPRSRQELIRKYLSAKETSTRLYALRVMGEILDPDTELILMACKATADESPLVRERAHEMVVKLQRRLR